MIPAGLALLLVACAPEEEAFRTDADVAICDWKADCYDEDYGQCVDDAAGTWEPVAEDCTYDARTARECLAGLEQLECPVDLADLDEPEDFGFPSACDQVWACD